MRILTNRYHVIAFAVVVGFLIYLSNALFAATVNVSLPMDADWCLDVVYLEGADGEPSRELCSEFKNDAQQAVYHYNLDVIQINRYWLYFMIATSVGLTYYAGVFRPRQRGDLTLKRAEAFMRAGFLGVAIALFAPMIYSAVLPAPAVWFPNVIKDFADYRVERILEAIL